MPFRNHKENNHTDTNQDTSKRNTQTSKQQSSVSTLDDATISISVKFSLNLASNMLYTLCLQQILISWSLSNWGTCLLWHTKAIRVNSKNEYILEACLFIGWQWHAAICTIPLDLLVAGYWSSWMTSSISIACKADPLGMLKNSTTKSKNLLHSIMMEISEHICRKDISLRHTWNVAKVNCWGITTRTFVNRSI
jgi:hypothetical protein